MFHQHKKSSVRSRSRFSCLNGVDSINLAFISITALITVCFSNDLCSNPWTFSKYSGTCIRFYYNNKKSWNGARQVCGKFTSDLVVIENKQQNDFLHATIAHADEGFWIGLNDLKKEGEYKWLNSMEQPKFLNWLPTQPNVPEDRCVQINHAYGKATREWTDDPCDDEVNFMCERNSDTTGKCSAEWFWSVKAGTCMRIFFDEMSWRSAKEHCRNKGAELLMILNEETNNFLQEFLNPHDDFYWIGLSNIEDHNTYKWLDYADEVIYTKWASDPNLKETKCAVVKMAQEGWKIADCEQKKKFICEKYSDNCLQNAEAICPVNCSSSCQDNACNRRSGVCTLGCIDGFKEPQCNEMCANNTYGKDCNNTCNPNCGGPDKACNVSTGICLHGCSKEFSGPFCSNHTPIMMCANNTYGENCNNTCNPNCGGPDKACNVSTGICLHGCSKEFSGPFCSERTPLRKANEEKSSNDLAPIGGILLLLLLVILLLLILTKKKSAKKDQEDEQSKPTQPEIKEEDMENAMEEVDPEERRKSRKSAEEQVEDLKNEDQHNPDP